MPVNIEIKGNLARLLATENLIVEHKKVETAQFDTKSRVLTLPMWNTASNYVYDMLVAHEVGHALFTPCELWKVGEYARVPKSYVNIIEDVRIERLMKQKFAGLNRDFYKGYEELNANDFFELENIDINQMKLIDKINLYFKVGAYLCIEFNDIENEFVTQAAKVQTFDEVKDLAKRIHLYTKAEQERRRKEQEQQRKEKENNDTDKADLDTPSYQLEEVEGKGDVNDIEYDDEDGDGEEESGMNAGWDNIDESNTQEAFDRNSDKLRDRHGRETIYVTIPQVNLDNVVIPFDVVYKELKDHFELQVETRTESDGWYYQGSSLSQAKQSFRDYKKSASKDVNNLVKEFEMKKSADSYARQGISKTGVLDTSKLHTYMFNEDIFKKVITVPDGKNHGLVFLLDWSGSMQHIMSDTIKQLYNLIWFCRKVSIPFEVYAFSNDAWALGVDNTETSFYSSSESEEKNMVHEIKEGDLAIEGHFRMVNVLTSTTKSKKLDEMMLLLWLQANAFQSNMYDYCRKFTLSGTPLNEAIIAVGQLTKRLMKTAKLQKCHVITLTDGEGFGIQYHTMRTPYTGGDSYLGKGSIYPSETVIRHNGKTFLGAFNEPEFTCKLVEAVKSDIPNSSFIAIRLLEKGGLRHFYNWYARRYYDDITSAKYELIKKGLISFKSLSFDMWFAMNGKSIHVDDELDVDAGAEKRKITAAFRKMNKNKKTNKFMVKEFINQIA